MFRRIEKGLLAEWWWTVDRFLFGAITVLLALGIIISLTASPPVALRLDYSPWYFVERQLVYATAAFFLLTGLSFSTVLTIKRVALGCLLVSLVLMVFVLVLGDSTKGASRWLNIFGFSFQPSELLKPAFVVILSWLIAEWPKRSEYPVIPLHMALLALSVILLVLQPDIGQTLLILMVWAAMIFFAGLHWRWIGLLSGVLLFGFTLAYSFLPHVSYRVNTFISTGGHGHYQIQKAYGAINNGGWLGEGVGEGTFTRRIPDAHSDFIFAVLVEEYGVIIGAMVIVIYMMIVGRCFYHALRIKDRHLKFCLSGLAMLIGFQTMIHIGVNLSLLPPTGMTLPLVSYGGSSLLSSAVVCGCILALAKKHEPVIGRSYN